MRGPWAGLSLGSNALHPTGTAQKGLKMMATGTCGDQYVPFFLLVLAKAVPSGHRRHHEMACAGITTSWCHRNRRQGRGNPPVPTHGGLQKTPEPLAAASGTEANDDLSLGLITIFWGCQDGGGVAMPSGCQQGADHRIFRKSILFPALHKYMKTYIK